MAIVAMTDRNLRYKLDSGASRVFNCLAITQQILTENKDTPADELFFKNRRLNNIVLIKEPNMAVGGDPFNAPLPIRTKVFIPYNLENPYEGGESKFTDEEGIESALEYFTGMNRKLDPVFKDDFRKIKVLEQMPSLDPFLLRDKLTLERITTSHRYFNLSEEEWNNIRGHIREKFFLMCQFATDGRATADKVDLLVDKIWDGRDLQALAPMLAAFNLPPDQAPELFYSWKGISFFNYEFTKNTANVRAFSHWLNTTTPRGAADRTMGQEIDRDRDAIKAKLRVALSETISTLNEFNNSFDLLFKKRETAKNFVDFMGSSRKHFWRLGNHLNGIYHAVSLFKAFTRRAPEQRLDAQNLTRLLGIIHEIL
ncbi:MAG: hypothetical protein HYR63_07740 [Proteobacteria bacterium]|nr:hypothetical protein [Pseudomonadota bacterium]MBI3497814.1 hypothetical protein [Pseudomonadota bacterium]